MATFTRDNYEGLVDEIMDEWAGWYSGDFGVHSQVFLDTDTGEMWQETNGQNSWARFSHGGYVEIADVRRPDDFGDADYLDMARDEVYDAIYEGLSR